MARNPNDQLARARTLLQTGNAPGAQVLIDAVLARAPANPEANYLLGMVRLMAGEARAAEAPLQITLRSDPNNAMALDSLGLCYLMQRRFGEAEQALRKAAAHPRAPAVVVMRFEADSEAAIARIQAEFKAVLLAAKPDAKLPF